MSAYGFLESFLTTVSYMAKKNTNISMGQVFKTIIWPRRKLVLLGLFFIIISRLAGLVAPGAVKYLVDDVFANGNLDLLKTILIVVTAAVTVQAVTSFLLTNILSVEAQHYISQLRVKVQKKVMYLPVRFFDNAKSGELVARIMTDVEGVRNLVGTGLSQMVGGVLSAILSLVLLISISPVMTAYVLVPMGIFGFISMRSFSKIRPIFRERGKINAEVTGRLTETLNGIRV
ncbi:MAG: ABC-type multidrug transport system fused ATPase/permease subunit, partial [Cyclobacteriaceae bacterium]